MNHEDFSIIFGMMTEYFESTPSDGITEIYFNSFRDWSIEDFKRACQSVMENRIYNKLPKIGEIREVMMGNFEDACSLAYYDLIQGLRYGAWVTIIFEDGAIGQTVKAMGGWERVCEITWDEWKFRRKEFESLYKAFLRRGEIDPVKFVGQIEAHNSTNEDWRRYIPEPIFICSRTSKFLSKEKPKLEIKKDDGKDF